MKPLDRSSFIRGKNRNILLSRDLQSQSRMHKSHQKHADFQGSMQLGHTKQDKIKMEPRFEVDLKRNPQLNILKGNERKPKLQDKGICSTQKSSFQKTMSGFHTQYKQHSSGKFYQTSINGFLITNNRPMSKKNTRDRLKPTNRIEHQYRQQYEDQTQYIEAKESKRYTEQSQLSKYPCIKRPETSKGQRVRGVENKHHQDEQLMNQLIPETFQQVQLPRFAKKQESFQVPFQNQKKKRNHPMSAVQKKRDVADLIKLNSNTQRKSVNDFVVPFETTLSPEFICLFANGK